MVRKKNKESVKKKFNLKREYKESWEYIKQSREFVYSSLLIFSIFVIIGIFLPIPEEINKMILDFIEKLIEETKGISGIEMILFIFKNNLWASFFGMILGVFLGIYPFFASLLNGYILGFVAKIAIISGEAPSLFGLLPHGIFELPAVFISLGIGLKLGSFIFQKEKVKFLKENISESIRVFVLIVVPLLIIAAIIEGSLIVFVK